MRTTLKIDPRELIPPQKYLISFLSYILLKKAYNRSSREIQEGGEGSERFGRDVWGASL